MASSVLYEGQPMFAKVDQTKTDNFKNWFGDWEKTPEKASKVVDDNGQPLVVYHGTGSDFNTFDKEMIGSNFNADNEGFFFTSVPSEASQYANYKNIGLKREQGNNVKPVYLSIKNPLVITEKVWNEKYKYYGGPDNEGTVAFWDNNQDKIKEIAKNMKADGIIIKEANGPYNMFVALNLLK